MEFAALVSALQSPEIYPDRPRNVRVVQTHISVIFLTGKHAYKIKKPVNFGFLDFTTLEKRKFYCEQEVVLNRRLAPEIYLGVVEIRDDRGTVRLGSGAGRIVEYAVLMKELPPDCTMDRWLDRGALDSGHLKRVAQELARFHLEAARGPEIAAYGELATIRKNVEENFTQTEKYAKVTLPAESFAEIRENTRRFMELQAPLFKERIAAGKIGDCHGDLHLQHVCLEDGVFVFDCIEFNERFRYSDVAADIAFLLMDLEAHGAPLLAADLASYYLRFSRDWGLYRLLEFYKCYRAYVRGKVISFRLEDPVISEREKSSALGEARRYFRLAAIYARILNRPLLLITCGLMGTGKSTIARMVSEALGLESLSSDVSRKELARLSPREHRYEKFHQGIYAPDFSRQTYRFLFDRASGLLGKGQSVFIDASFKTQGDRSAALDLAQRMNAEFLLVECRCSEEEIRRRLARRTAEGTSVSDGRWSIFEEQKKDFEKVRGVPPDLHLVLNTNNPPEKILAKFFEALLRRKGRELERETAGAQCGPGEGSR
jgi:uncharacterized protein